MDFGSEGFLAGLAGGLQGGISGYKEGLERQRQKRKDSLEEIYHQAPLLEQGYKVEETGNEEKPFGLIQTDSQGSLKRQLEKAQLLELQNKQAMAPIENASKRLDVQRTQQAILHANQEAEAAKHAKDPENLLMKQGAREAARTGGLMNALQANHERIKALEEGSPIVSLNPFAGTTKYGLANKGYEAAMRQAGQKENGELGSFDQSENPGSFDPQERVQEKLMKAQNDILLQLQNLGIDKDPRVQRALVKEINMQGATPNIGQMIRHPVNSIGGLLKGQRRIDTSPAEKNGSHPMDNAAVSWAKGNPKDPKAKEILRLNGIE